MATRAEKDACDLLDADHRAVVVLHLRLALFPHTLALCLHCTSTACDERRVELGTDPIAQVFPNLIPQVNLFDALHRDKTVLSQKKRLKFFWLVFIAIFVWEV